MGGSRTLLWGATSAPKCSPFSCPSLRSCSASGHPSPPPGLQLLPPLGKPFLSCPSFRAGKSSPPPRTAAGLTSASSNTQSPRAVARCTTRWTGTAPCLLARAEPTLQSVRGESGSLNFSPCKPSRILTLSRSLLRTHQQ